MDTHYKIVDEGLLAEDPAAAVPMDGRRVLERLKGIFAGQVTRLPAVAKRQAMHACLLFGCALAAVGVVLLMTRVLAPDPPVPSSPGSSASVQLVGHAADSGTFLLSMLGYTGAIIGGVTALVMLVFLARTRTTLERHRAVLDLMSGDSPIPDHVLLRKFVQWGVLEELPAGARA